MKLSISKSHLIKNKTRNLVTYLALIVVCLLISCQKKQNTQPMNKELFWKIIGEAKEKSGVSLELRNTLLVNELSLYSPQDIMKFHSIAGQYVGMAEENLALWGACKVIEGYASDDTFLYFCCWLVSEGKDVYIAAMSNPDTLADISDIEEYVDEGHIFEYLMSVPFDAYEEKTGESLYEIMSDPEEIEKIESLTVPLSESEVKGLLEGISVVDDAPFRDSEEDAKRNIAIYLPKLTAKFGYDAEADLREIAKLTDPIHGMDNIRENLRAAGLNPDDFPEFATQPQPSNIDQFSEVRRFDCGVAAVKKDGKWGFINEEGIVVIPLKYENVNPFDSRIAPQITIAKYEGKYGYINIDGVEITPFKYDVATHFNPSLGYAWVELNGKKGFVDKKGTELVPLKYDELNFGYDELSLGFTKVKGRIGDKWELITFE